MLTAKSLTLILINERSLMEPLGPVTVYGHFVLVNESYCQHHKCAHRNNSVGSYNNCLLQIVNYYTVKTVGCISHQTADDMLPHTEHSICCVHY